MNEHIYEYIRKWKTKKNVIGIVLSGSYATKLNTKNSDVDLRIIFSEDEEAHYKGVETVSGLEYSYITGTIQSSLRTIHNQFFRVSKFEARIFSLGIILYEKNGEIKELKEKASSIMDLDFDPPSEELLLLKKYMLSNSFSNFINMNIESRLFKYYYYQFLDHIFKAYSSYLTIEVPTIEKLNRILFDSEYRIKNNFNEFSDKNFLQLWEDAVNAESTNYIIKAKELYKHVEECWGIFDATNFKAMI
jgi:hypothetical protein